MILSWCFVYYVFASIWLAYGQALISRNLTTYTSAALELECEILSGAVVVSWAEVHHVGANIELFILSVSDGQTTDNRQGDKYDNFGHTQNPNSFYNLIITDATKDDDGAYVCDNTPGDDVQFQVDVEVPGAVSIKNGSQDVDTLTVTVGEVYEITCSAIGTKSKKELSFDWEPDLEGGTVDSQQNADDADLIDYKIIATYKPRKEDTSITCQLTGYLRQEEIKDSAFDSITLNVRFKPECSLTVVNTVGSDCRMITLTCECTAVPESTAYFFYSGSSLINSTVVNTINVKVDYDTTSDFSCQASNDIGTGEMSNQENHLCDDGTTTTTTAAERIFTTSDTNINGPTTEPITTTEGLSTTVNTEINDSPGINTGLIAACSIVAVIFAAALVFVIVILIRRYQTSPRKETNQSFPKEVEETNDGTDHNAYMDLQTMGNEKSRVAEDLQIPERNVKLVSILPGNGLLQYHKALITRAKGNQEGVVRTLSDNSTLATIKILRSEVQENLKLGNDNNIVQLLGWCDTVPTFAIFELVCGRNLSNHLKEEFSPHSVHTYGNTKKKRFQVSEKGNIDVLPKYALHVARGIQFLTKNKFLHPGLRAKNVLLDTTGNCKLYEFVSLENAKEWTRLIWNESVPYQWMPPEFLFLEAISSAGDIWSFGVLIWEIFSYGSEPYIGQRRSDVERKIRQRELLPMPNNCPGAIWQLMLSCWQSSADERLPIDDITSTLTLMCHQDKEYQEIR